MSLPYKSIIKKFRHACTLCRGGEKNALPSLQPLWCHLQAHFLTGLEDLTINFLKTPSPALPPPPPPSTGHSLTSCLENRRFSSLFPPQPKRKPQRSLPDFFSGHLFSLERTSFGSRSWRWWRRKSKPCSSNLMMQRSVSRPYKGSWTVNWKIAKKWENSYFTLSFLWRT